MIVNAIHNAYKKLEERNWDTIYWAIDLHGVCLESNYENGKYTFINEGAKEALQLIASLQESVLILWSGCHPEEQVKIIEFFKGHGIRIDHFNENPREASTTTGNFADKFYFSVLLDDKAGFDPEYNWDQIMTYFRTVYPKNDYVHLQLHNKQ